MNWWPQWNWWVKLFGTGTPDDRRNFGWRISEALRVQVLWAWTILDIRFGTVRKNKFLGLTYFWPIYIRLPYRTEQNCWNGFFTIQLYIVGWRYFVWPKLHILFRPIPKYYLQVYSPGLLFDRGEYSLKIAIMSPEPSEPQWVEEGSI